MMYVIARSRFKGDVNRYFMSDVPPRIGKAFQHGDKIYRVIDIECVVDETEGCTTVRGKVARVL